MGSIVDRWPLFGLTIRTPRLELRLPRDEDMAEALAVVDQGIHDPAVTPFHVPWTDTERPVRDHQTMQFWWRNRAGFSAASWNLDFFVFNGGSFIGSQGLSASDFPTVRTASTGSWLGQAFQGQGFGKEMRRAVLELAFVQLEAFAVTSEAFLDNVASQRVSLAVGYEDNGRSRLKRRDSASEQVNFRLTRDRWNETRTEMPVEVSGFSACADMFGLAD